MREVVFPLHCDLTCLSVAFVTVRFLADDINKNCLIYFLCQCRPDE